MQKINITLVEQKKLICNNNKRQKGFIDGRSN